MHNNVDEYVKNDQWNSRNIKQLEFEKQLYFSDKKLENIEIVRFQNIINAIKREKATIESGIDNDIQIEFRRKLREKEEMEEKKKKEEEMKIRKEEESKIKEEEDKMKHLMEIISRSYFNEYDCGESSSSSGESISNNEMDDNKLEGIKEEFISKKQSLMKKKYEYIQKWGECYRNNWNDVDGRTIRDQAGYIVELLKDGISCKQFREKCDICVHNKWLRDCDFCNDESDCHSDYSY